MIRHVEFPLRLFSSGEWEEIFESTKWGGEGSTSTNIANTKLIFAFSFTL